MQASIARAFRIDHEQTGIQRALMEKGQLLRALILLNALAMSAAAVVLAIWPDWIPNTVSIPLYPDQRLLAYLLAAGELALAYLCYSAAFTMQQQLLRQTSLVLIVLHSASGLGGLAAVAGGASIVVLANVALRVLLVVALAVLVPRKIRPDFRHAG